MTNRELIDQLRQLYPQGDVQVILGGNVYIIDQVDEDIDGTIVITVVE
jgi:hypothetical protein